MCRDGAPLRQMSNGDVHFRERANLQLANRRLERKVKEMVMQGEEEQHALQDQKDQVRHHTSPLPRLLLTFESFHNELS